MGKSCVSHLTWVKPVACETLLLWTNLSVKHFLKAHFLREKISRLFFHMHAQKVEVGSLVNLFEMRHGLVTSSQSQ